MGMSEFSNWVRKWWPGLIPLAALWVAAAWTGTVPMEQHLTARAAAALKESVLDKTQIEVAGRDVRLSADAFSEQGRSTAVDQVASVAGVRTVVDQPQLIAEVTPYVWSIERDVVHVTLGGNAPLLHAPSGAVPSAQFRSRPPPPIARPAGSIRATISVPSWKTRSFPSFA